MNKRNTKYLLVGMACAALLAVAWLFAANMRAKGMMEEARKRYAAMGEELGIGPLVPKADLLQANGGQQMLDALSRIRSVDRDLVSLSMYYSGPGRAFVFSQLTNWPGELRRVKREWVTNVWDEISFMVEPRRDALRRLWDVATNDVIIVDLPIEEKHINVLLRHLAPLKDAVRTAQLAAFLDLHEDRQDEALHHLLGATRLIAKYDSEPFLITQLVRHGCAEILSKAIWDALQYPGWSDQQLKELQDTVGSVDMVEPMIAAMRMERALGHKVWQLSIAQPGYLNQLGGGGAPKTLIGAIGSGDIDDVADMIKGTAWGVTDGYHDGRFHLDWFQSNVVAMEMAVASGALQSAKFAPGSIPRRYYFSGMMLPALSRAWEKAIAAETRKRMIVMAIAIKRHQLKHGRIPKDASELVSEFLPAPPADSDGDPLRYVAVSETEFRLWAVGRDGIDGGGVPVATNKSPMFDQDMIWPQPATAEEVARKRAELESMMK